MTPERKKKLRSLLTNHARIQIELETKEKIELRRKVISERCGQAKDLNGLSDDQLRAVCKEYHERVKNLENGKYDLEKEQQTQLNLLDSTNIEVNNLRGKFVKPALKKVSNTQQDKFAKLQKTAKDFNFRQKLKVVKKKEFSICEEEPVKTKPEWSKSVDRSFVSETPPESPTVKENNDSSSGVCYEGEE